MRSRGPCHLIKRALNLRMCSGSGGWAQVVVANSTFIHRYTVHIYSRSPPERVHM